MAIELPQIGKPRWEHQVVGIKKVVETVEPEIGRIYPGCVAIWDEAGAGKTRQAIDGAQALFLAGEITHVIVVAPAAVPPHWCDPDPLFGEIAQYRWPQVSMNVAHFHGKTRIWEIGDDVEHRLTWLVTNYEYIRSGDFKNPKSNLGILMKFTGPRTLLIVDESHHCGNPRAKQTRAVMRLRRACGRVIEMTGTPEASGTGANEPGEDDEVRSKGSIGTLYSQAAILDPRILACKTWTDYRAKYAIIGGWRGKEIVGWHKDGVEDVQRRLAPYVLRREKKDCMDLPQALPPVTITVPLSEKTWRFYREMRDDAMAWLSEQKTSFTRQAGVRVMRLSQITSGFVGGLRNATACPDCQGDDPECEDCGGSGISYESIPPEFCGDEKLRVTIDQIKSILEEKKDAKIVIWCRFVMELQRLLESIKHHFPDVSADAIVGGQRRQVRMEALRLLKPTTAPPGPVAVTCTPGSGSTGLDFAAGSHVIWQSRGTSLRQWIQASERVHRGGQVNRVWSADVVATGPKGQKTIDHTLIRSMRRKDDAAAWTCAAWVTAIKKEQEEE